jgi:type I restriction enzyme S subunit
MSLCDRLEEQLRERETRHTTLARASLGFFSKEPTPANLELLFHPSYNIEPTQLRKTILALAVQGKLVSQDPSDELAKDLCARVVAEKAQLIKTNIIKSESPFELITEEETLFSIPTSWIWVRAGNLCRPISSGSTPAQGNFNAYKGIPFLKVYNIRGQAVDFNYKRQYIDTKYHEERMRRSKLYPGDLIMNIVGPPLGKVAIVPPDFEEWNCNQAIAFFRPVIPELVAYLYIFLQEGSFLRNIHLIGTAGQDNISVTKCKNIPIPLPPLAEQRRIVAKVDQLMVLLDKYKAQLNSSRGVAEKLLDAMVAELTSEA